MRKDSESFKNKLKREKRKDELLAFILASGLLIIALYAFS